MTPNRRPADTRQRLVDAALALIEAHGWQEVRLAEVARSCGVSAPACYKHFPSKAALMAAALHQQSADLGHQVDRRLDGVGDDPVEILLAIGEVLVELADRRPRIFDFTQLSPPALQALGDLDSHPLLALTRREVERLVRSRGGDPEPVHLLIWSCIQGYTRLIAAGVARPDRDLMRSAIETVITIGDRP